MSNVTAISPPARDPNYALLDNKQAAEFIGMSIKSLDKDRCVGHLGIPFVKLGRAVRYRESDLKSWIDSRLVSC